jgi:predicted lactoylglutathione lyase
MRELSAPSSGAPERSGDATGRGRAGRCRNRVRLLVVGMCLPRKNGRFLFRHDPLKEPTMPRQLFVNLPVRDLPKAKAFYEAIGAVNNPQFSDDTAACMVLSDTIFVMLLTHPKWASFTRKPIADAHQASEVMLALNADDRQAVDTIVAAAGAHGGKADVNPVQDLGFMYGRSFEDVDGHIWETFVMDMSQMPAQ